MEGFAQVDSILPVPAQTFDLHILTMKLYGVLVLMATLLTGRTRHESFYITLSLTFVLQSTAAFKYILLKI